MVDYTNIPRDSRRVPLETRVQFKFDRFSGFLSEYSSNISPGGMFIRTRTPLPPGQTLDFAFRLGDGFELIKGKGEIVWTRTEDEGPVRPAGMGLRFLELSDGSKELIYRIVDQHILEGGTPFDVSLVPPDPVPSRPAPAPVLPFAPPEPQAAPPSPVLPDPFPELSAPDPRVESSPDASVWLPSVDVPEPEPFPAIPEFQAYLESNPAPGAVSSAAPAVPEPAPLAVPTFGSAAAKQPRSPLPFILLAAGLLLVAGLFLFKDRLLDLVGMGGGEDEVAEAPPPPARRPAPAPAAAGAAPEIVEEGQPAGAQPALVPAPAAAEPARPAGPPASFVERITWEETAGGTDVILWSNGAIRSDRFTRERIAGNPPREVFRLTGIERPFPGSRVVVGTGDVLQVRVGYHPKAGGSELHVVLDLAHPSVAVARVEEGEDRLRIHLERQ